MNKRKRRKESLSSVLDVREVTDVITLPRRLADVVGGPRPKGVECGPGDGDIGRDTLKTP